MPLAVTLRSAATHLRAGLTLVAYVVDAGIADGNWMALKETLAGLPIQLIRIGFDPARLGHLPVSHHISHAAYARLLAADILPQDLSRVIYLDSDLLVLDDLSTLWRTPMDGAWCLAVPDIACPFIDARHADSNFLRASPYFATIAPVKNWRSLGLRAADHYFNSGVLVIDLDAWRREQLAARFLACLADHAAFVWCWDQYALNVVLAGHWRRLPLRWNVGSHLFDYPQRRHAPLDERSIDEALAAPAILHFTSEFKPWRYGSRHPARARFFAALAETAWRDWRPRRPAVSLSVLSQRCGVLLQQRSTIFWRWLSARMRPARPPEEAASTVAEARLPAEVVDVVAASQSPSADATAHAGAGAAR
jgi:lipopolysaccharide biosynthesis glycosyltransferase